MISRWKSSGARDAAAFAKANVELGGGAITGSKPRFLSTHFLLTFIATP